MVSSSRALRGLLLGIKNDVFEIEHEDSAAYFLDVQIRNRVSNFRFWVVNVYGPAQHENAGDFIQELSEFCDKGNLPILLGGDFNLIRNDKERNIGHGDRKLMEMFNDFIGQFRLRELFISGAKFTWSNKQLHPILVKLDRILVTDNWEDKFPKCYAWSKARVGSDHCPLILDSGEQGNSRPRYFFFQEQWLHNEGFYKLVSDKWREVRTSFNQQSYSLDIWHGCLQALRKFLKGWNLNLLGSQRMVKTMVTKRIQEIDNFAESRILDIT
jgi:hypothetical protein